MGDVMDNPEEQNEMGRIMSIDAQVRERTRPLQEQIDILRQRIAQLEQRLKEAGL